MGAKLTKDALTQAYVGKTIRVTDSKVKSLYGIEGEIVDETKNMFILKIAEKKIKIIKNQIHFIIGKNQKPIDGKEISKTHDERLKMRIKND